MKKNYNFILLLFAVSTAFSTFSQIQLTPGDIVHGGSFNVTLDSTGNFTAGPSGANCVWDFRGLANQLPFDYQVVGYSGHGNGNEANLVKINGVDTYSYFLQTSSAMYNIVPLQDFDKMSYKKLKIFSCPLQYQDVNGDSFEMATYYPGYLMGIPSQDSVRLYFKMTNASVADAWGVIKMPAQDYNALRIMTRNTVTIRMAGKKGGNPYTDIPAYSHDETVIAYSWYARDLGTYLATYNPDDGQVEYLISSTLSVGHQNVATGITFSNPCTGKLHITNNGNDKFNIMLLDMQGKLVLSWHATDNSSYSIDVSTLPAGFYTMQLQNTGTQAISYEKIVKQ